VRVGSAEGATAPETLRQRDRSHEQTLKSYWRLRPSVHRRSKQAAQLFVNLSGQDTEGAHWACDLRAWR